MKDDFSLAKTLFYSVIEDVDRKLMQICCILVKVALNVLLHLFVGHPNPVVHSGFLSQC